MVELRKHWYNLCQRMFCLCSLIGVLWSCLILKSLSHFEDISVYNVRVCSNFIDLPVAVQLSQYALIEGTICCIFLPPLSKMN